MPVLHIANTTKQNQRLYYRVPGKSRVYELDIPAGQQRELPHRDLTTEEIGMVLKGVERYSIIDEALIPNMKVPPSGL